MNIDPGIRPDSLRKALDNFWKASGEKILAIEKNFDAAKGAPVFTVGGRYTSRGWTEWTQGFQYGSAILQFDATGEKQFLEIGRRNTLSRMAPHLTHQGVHDHGFNNISTYGNLLRLMAEGRIPQQDWEQRFYELALKVSGAVQAMRWTPTSEGGFIYSFNGPHSLFVDTIRSCRILMISHALGHFLAGENDARINLFHRAVHHLLATAKYAVYYGDGRDQYDVAGRTAHESIFNVNDGNYRCPGSQQGYSAFSTWMRGLAWAMCGFAECLEFVSGLDEGAFNDAAGRSQVLETLSRAARVTCDFYIANTAADGIPYWDSGAPGLANMGDYLQTDSDPYNDYEPVDSSAACIGAQALMRFGNFLLMKKDQAGQTYLQAGLSVAATLFSEPYLSADPKHEGLILHSVYHRPNGWDNIPEGRSVPCDESGMWGDYHARELAVLIHRMIAGEKYHAFFNCLKGS